MFENKELISPKEIEDALDFCVEQVVRNLDQFTYAFQNAYSEAGFYQPIENVEWTTGFWTGEIWLAYEHSHLEILREAAEIQIDSFAERIGKRIAVEHHDMGFLYSPSCVAGYKLVGSQAGRDAAIAAADQLITRYHPIGEFIQAWGPMDAPENYRLIIDCLLNLPLLYWASEETGETKYREIAEKHIHTALENVVREDASTWHTFFFDMKTGARCDLSGVSGRLRVGERTGMGYLRLCSGVSLYEAGRIYYVIQAGDGIFYGASAAGYDSVLGSVLYGWG